MTQATAKKRMTEAEFLAIPDDGVRRWLIDGELWEFGMTVRNQDHSRVLLRLGQLLGMWLDTQPSPRGELFGGEAGFRLPLAEQDVVGIDVAYVDATLAGQRSDETTLVDGAPVLAAEVLSPSDTIENIRHRIRLLLRAGVKVVWIVDPEEETVRVRRKGVPSQTLNTTQELTAEPELPGFRVPVASLFSRG